jgi:hypothetical protein
MSQPPSDRDGEITLGEVYRAVENTNRQLKEHREEAARHREDESRNRQGLRDDIHRFVVKQAEMEVRVATTEGAIRELRVKQEVYGVFGPRLDALDAQVKDLSPKVEKFGRIVGMAVGAAAIIGWLVKILPWSALWK